jgi:hypothetical protein
MAAADSFLHDTSGDQSHLAAENAETAAASDVESGAELEAAEVMEAESAVLVDEGGLAARKNTGWWGIKERRSAVSNVCYPFC